MAIFLFRLVLRVISTFVANQQTWWHSTQKWSLSISQSETLLHSSLVKTSMILIGLLGRGRHPPGLCPCRLQPHICRCPCSSWSWSHAQTNLHFLRSVKQSITFMELKSSLPSISTLFWTLLCLKLPKIIMTVQSENNGSNRILYHCMPNVYEYFQLITIHRTK